MTGRAALIGHTGFVGSFLKSSGGYTHLYNSSNIDDIRGEQFETVVCAGAPAAKWLANAEPGQDRQNIRKLTDSLARVRATQFFLISTVDVFPTPVQVDENTAVKLEGLHPYGAHRYELENFVRGNFAQSSILRLPALFGPGLRKNALYDLLHDNCLEQVPLDGVFQWYNLRRLPQDLRRTADLPLAHMVTEPVSMRVIIDRLFPDKAKVGRAGKAARYDVRTVHAGRFGGKDGYIAGAEAVLAELDAYVREERGRMAGAA